MGKSARRSMRNGCTKLIRYVLNEPTGERGFWGMMFDLSRSGFCMGTNHRLSEGQEIMIKSPLALDAQRAVVRWSEKVNDSLFKVGLEMSVHEASPR
ncbi:MAG: PilZ domain-containing protein [Nitrospirota bacterium]